jgi:hypothetical protein
VRRKSWASAFGRVAIPKARLRDSRAGAVLFCHRVFFCGAIRPARDRLGEYDEYLIAITPVVVR